ncbi:MAG: hypothetical protein ACJA16_004605, partial [Akkermansiaceae bacterium]
MIPHILAGRTAQGGKGGGVEALVRNGTVF